MPDRQEGGTPPSPIRRFEFADDGAYRYGRFSAEDDDKAVWIQRLLSQVDVDSRRWHDYIQLSSDDLDRWIDWLGEPVPGVEHKWSDSLIEYRALRESPATEAEYQTAICRHALEVARERTEQPLTTETFDDRVSIVDSGAVADVLGGGDFQDALSVVGISPTQQDAPPSSGNPTPIDSSEWSFEETVDAVRAAAEATDGPLTIKRYRRYRAGQDHPLPSVDYIRETFGHSWTDILQEAGVDAVIREKTLAPTYEQFLDALIELREALGEWPTSAEYPDEQPSWAPARGTVYGMDEFESWPESIEDAEEHHDN